LLHSVTSSYTNSLFHTSGVTLYFRLFTYLFTYLFIFIVVGGDGGGGGGGGVCVCVCVCVCVFSHMFSMTTAIMWELEDNFWSWLSPTFASVAFEIKSPLPLLPSG
jgi:hypothetical protein